MLPRSDDERSAPRCEDPHAKFFLPCLVAPKFVGFAAIDGFA
jgi:hypothetical protein